MTVMDDKRANIARRIRMEALRARARAEVRLPLAEPVRVVFTALAAAGSELALPDQLLAQNDPLISISCARDHGEITLNIATQGFARTDALRNRVARLFSADGTIDEMFVFDSGGQAQLKLADSTVVVTALNTSFSLDVDT